MPSIHALSPIAALAALALFGASGAAMAGTLADGGSYNNPYGMTQAQENTAVNPSMRDANGNLEMVNGQILTGNISMQSGVGAANTTGTGSGAMYGGATAIGNSLNVVTTGNNNTVIVTANQKNSGDVTATTTVNGQ